MFGVSVFLLLEFTFIIFAVSFIFPKFEVYVMCTFQGGSSSSSFNFDQALQE